MPYTPSGISGGFLGLGSLLREPAETEAQPPAPPSVSPALPPMDTWGTAERPYHYLTFDERLEREAAIARAQQVWRNAEAFIREIDREKAARTQAKQETHRRRGELAAAQTGRPACHPSVAERRRALDAMLSELRWG